MSARQSFRYFLTKYFAQPEHLSRRELAERAGISHVHIIHILKGDREPTLSMAERICHALNVNLRDVLN